MFIETNPPRRGGPPCPPAPIDTVLPSVDAYAALAGWMHRVCADAAGRYEPPVVWSGSVLVMPLIETNPPRRVGPLRPPERIGLRSP